MVKVNLAFRRDWAFDYLFWGRLIMVYFGLHEDGTYKAGLDPLPTERTRALEPLVRMKIQETKQCPLVDWGQERRWRVWPSLFQHRNAIVNPHQFGLDRDICRVLELSIHFLVKSQLKSASQTSREVWRSGARHLEWSIPPWLRQKGFRRNKRLPGRQFC